MSEGQSNEPKGNPSEREPKFPRSSLTPSHSPKYWVKEKDRFLRQLLISDIQAVTKRPLVVYFTQLDQAINHTDPDDLAEILSGVSGDVADVFIQTPGGNVDATEKLVNILEKKLKSWRVIVPSWAKSAGTVISLSSEEIIFGLNSELGPIDPQVQTAAGMMPCEILARDGSQPFALREMANLAVQRMRLLAKSILQKGMMKSKTEAELDALLSKVSTTTGYMSHGAVIDYNEATALGLSAKYLPPEDDLWKKIWLLYCMYDYDTKSANIGRIIEGEKFSIARPR